MSLQPLFAHPPCGPRKPRKKPSISIDLFCGGGGFSQGYRMATGRSPSIALNHSDAAIVMHAANHEDTIHLRADVDAVNPRSVVGTQHVRHLHASPTCTHFSRARGAAPKSVQLREQGWSVIRWVREVRPLVVTCENVSEWTTWAPLHPDDHPDEALRGQPIAERAGETWREWLQALRDLGYDVEYRLLTACDYGAPTSRERLFVIARRDGLPIVWPKPTHGPADSADVRAGRLLPYVSAASCIDFALPMCSIFATPAEAKAWAVAHDRKQAPKRPLAQATLNRIAEGMLRFVLGSRRPYVVGGVAPFVAKAHANGSDRPGSGIRPGDAPLGTNTTTEQLATVAASLVNLSHGGRVEDLEQPANTITATPKGGDRVLVSAGLVNTRNGEREGQAPRVRDLGGPAPTVTAQGSQGGVAVAQVMAPWLAKHYGGVYGHRVDQTIGTVTAIDHHALGAAYLEKLYSSASAGQSVEEPAPTVTAGGGHAAIVRAEIAPIVAMTPQIRERARKVVAFLTAYYGDGGTSAAADGPAPTITTRARLGLVAVTIESADGVTTEDLVTVTIDGHLWIVVDIAMRMLTPRELARCQGFPDDYVLTGTTAERIERIGNSVCPHPAAAIVRANLPTDHRDQLAAK